MTEKPLYEKKIKEILKDTEAIGKRNKSSHNPSVHYTRLIAEIKLQEWVIALVKEIDKRVGKGPWRNGEMIRITTPDGFMDAIPEYWIFLKKFLIGHFFELTEEDLK